MKKILLLSFIALAQISCVYESPTWSKDGNKLLFGVLFHDDADEEQYQFFLWQAKDMSIRQITQYDKNQYGMMGSISPNGKSFICLEKSNAQQDENEFTLTRRDIHLGTFTNISEIFKTDKHLPVYNPYNTLGDRLALTTYDHKAGLWQLYILESNGQKRLLDTSRLAQLPAWSPDNNWIAYLSSPANQEAAPLKSYTLVIQNTHDGKKIILAQGIPYPETEENIFSFLTPSWSPDASSIAFVYGNQIATLHIQSKKQKFITHTPALKIWPRYAPNAKFIAYNTFKASDRSTLSYGNNTVDIWITDPEGSINRQFTDLEGEAYLPSWQPSSDVIAFLYTNEYVSFLLSMVDSSGKIRFYPATRSQKIQLAEYYFDQSEELKEHDPALSRQRYTEAEQLCLEVIQERPSSYWAKKADELLKAIE